MSQMQVNRFCLYLILFSALGSLAFSQENEQYARLYQSQDIQKIEEMLETPGNIPQDWRQFFKTLFIENADSSVGQLVSLFNNTENETIKQFIRERISQFYFARGYYQTAEKILTDEIFVNRIFRTQQKPLNYGIQIGAFSTYDNALKIKNKLLKNISDISIISKIVNGQKLYIIVIGKFNSRNEAEKALNQYKSTHQVKGYVIQY